MPGQDRLDGAPFRGGIPIYAIIRSGGKQYRVEEGSIIEVERLNVVEGEKIDLDEVLMLGDGDDITVGAGTVPGAKVVVEVLEHGRGKKIIVFKYKAKTRYRRKNGHRQQYTRLAVREIVSAEKAAKAEPKKRTRKTAAKATSEETAGE
jgi:large subunit ribosomal protein L21